MDPTPEDRIDMIKYFGKHIDPQDWQHIKEMLEDNASQTIKFDILYWSDKNKRGYLIRAPKKNNKMPISIIW